MDKPIPTLHALVLAASEEARRDGSPTIETQHLLLAFAADDRAPWARTLASAGLDDAAIRGALDRELELSLAAAQVTIAADDRPPATPRPHGQKLRLGTSTRRAIERGAGPRRTGRPEAEHVLAGILEAPVGTVPRALNRAGVDTAALAFRLRGGLGGPA